MKQFSIKTISFFLLILFIVPVARAHELSGRMEVEGRFFFHDPLFQGQDYYNGSVALEPEYYHEWETGSSFTFVPFARFDSGDSRRTHFDIRELNYLWLDDAWELRVGVAKVFWGTTEFVHLVDIINQTDLVEDIDGEDKLGQPMVHLSVPRDWGVMDMFVLPWFRERTFPGTPGRLRTALEVDAEHARYESSTEDRHPDFALRYSHTIGNWDFGIYHFMGTTREPRFIRRFDQLIPCYDQINQTGLDMQFVSGQWLWKLESIYRFGQKSSFLATVCGFEYTIVTLGETQMDLGLIGEYAFDDRGSSAMTIYQNDVMCGLRLTANDPASSELLVGLIQEIDDPATAVSIEASRRIGSNCKLMLESWTFLNAPGSDPLASLLRDDFLRLQLAYYF